MLKNHTLRLTIPPTSVALDRIIPRRSTLRTDDQVLHGIECQQTLPLVGALALTYTAERQHKVIGMQYGKCKAYDTACPTAPSSD